MTAKFWQYDARIGRRWNVDPVDKEWESPYLANSGNPIWYTDPDGDNPVAALVFLAAIFYSTTLHNPTTNAELDQRLIEESEDEEFNKVIRRARGDWLPSGGDPTVRPPGTLPGKSPPNQRNNQNQGGGKNKSTQPEQKKTTSEDVKAKAKAEARAEKLSKKQREGKDFTKAGKKAVIDVNKANNNGTTKCQNCKIETTPAQQSKSGVTPPKTETQVDHINPKSNGGSGTPDNGQVLCRDCNIQKSDKIIPPPQ
ncbi:MAG: HNH endonuclease [Chitinophagales bacterium]|jgi:5-methylcytosine-specific restriction endonuclease McrA